MPSLNLVAMNATLKLKLLFTGLLLIALQSGAQQTFLKGFLLDSITFYPVRGATIKNSDTRQKVLTDSKVFFRIPASPNDVIYTIAAGYHFDTLRYSLLLSDTVTLCLLPSGNILPGVTVQAQLTRYQLDSMQRLREYEEAAGTKVKTVSRPNSGSFGIALNLDRVFKKRYKYQRSNEKAFSTWEKQSYIDYRFSPALVASYTGLKGDRLSLFMYRYTPSYEWLRQHPTNEAVLVYINEKLKLFHREEVR